MHERAAEWAHPNPNVPPNRGVVNRRPEIEHIMRDRRATWSPLWWWPCCLGYIPSFVINKCSNSLKMSIAMHSLSKIRRFRKFLNRMPFYHRIACNLFKERLFQSKYYQTFYLVPPNLYDTVLNIVFQRWYDKLWHATFAVSTDVRCKSPDSRVGVIGNANCCCFIRFIRLLHWFRNCKGLNYFFVVLC